MFETTIQIEGMMCTHCENHIQDVLRKAFNPKKVKASSGKKVATMLTESEVTEEDVHKAIDPTGYRVLGVECKPYVKKGLFHFGKK